MTIATINASEEHYQYIGQVYEEHHARLQHYFLIHLGRHSEADNCVNETIRLFFFFMKGRDWEAEAEYINVYLMRIAGLLCSRKLSENRAQRAAGQSYIKSNSLFNGIKNDAIQLIRERMEFLRFGLRAAEGVETV